MTTLGVMEPLPPDFARHLAEVVQPGHESGVAQVIQAAIHLDDAGLEMFLTMVAERVRSSAKPITKDELRGYLRASGKGARASGS
jgi:hypothetical protein